MRTLLFILMSGLAVMAQEGTGTSLSGQVQNSKTGEPIRRVTLTLRSATQGSAGTGPTAPAAPYTATTDAEGKYRMENVEPGSYRLAAERQGFVRQEYGGRSISMMGMTLLVTAKQEMKGLDLKMVPHAVISGKVLDEEEEPLARVQIQVMRKRFFQGKQQLVPTGGGMTLDTGEFRVADLPPGRYWLSATYRGQNQNIFSEAPRNMSGKPEEAYVPTYYPTSADEAGAQAIEVEAGQQLTGFDIRLRKARVYRIRGKVAGRVPEGQRMQIVLFPKEGGMGLRGGQGAMPKPDGTFEIAGVTPGSYFLMAMPNSGKAAVEVSREDVEGVVLTVGGVFAVTGKVRVEGDKNFTVTGMRVQLVPKEGIAFNAPNSPVKEDGTFALVNAAPDKYRVTVFGQPKGTWVKSIRTGDVEIIENGLDLRAAAELEVVLGVGVGQVTGTVQDSKQKAAAGSMVSLLTEPIQPERFDRMRVATTDQNGAFTLADVPPGDYKVYAWEDSEPGVFMDPEVLKKHEGNAKRVTVKAEGQSQVTLVHVEKQ